MFFNFHHFISFININEIILMHNMNLKPFLPKSGASQLEIKVLLELFWDNETVDSHWAVYRFIYTIWQPSEYKNKGKFCQLNSERI